ncbi:hypothetical protein OG809_17705 [Kribbella soli]
MRTYCGGACTAGPHVLRLSVFIVIGFILLPAVYIWSIIQAYSKAKSWNVAHGVIS